MDAAAFGMGKAVIASTGDVNSIYWNPAGLTKVDDNYVYGWARDADYQDAGESIQVHFYADKPCCVADSGEYIGYTLANDLSEMAVGGNGNHRFIFEIPASLKDGENHEIYAYAIGVDSDGALNQRNVLSADSPIATRPWTFC